MKKTIIGIVIGLAVGALAVALFFGPGSQPRGPAASKTSFNPVTAKLDAGGDFYLYASTESLIRAAEEFAEKVRKLIAAGSSGADGLPIFDFVVRLLKRSGITEISGVGASSIEIGPDLYRSRMVIHHYPGKGEGLLWRAMGEKPHALNELNLMPADAVMAGFSDFSLSALWQWFRKEAEASNLPKLKTAVASVEPELQKLGIPLEKILQSLDGGMGFLLTLDAEKTIAIPAGQPGLTIPEPGLAIMIAVKDDTLFNLLAQKLPMAQKTEEKGMKKLLIPLPPMPVPLKPTIVHKDGMLILASHEQVVESMFQARDKGKGLTATEEFQKLAAGIPQSGNAFRFIHPRFFRALASVQKSAMSMSPSGGEQGQTLRELFDFLQREWKFYGVVENTSEGMVMTFNHNLKLEYLLALPAMGVAGTAAAVAVPNFMKAREKAKENAPTEE